MLQDVLVSKLIFILFIFFTGNNKSGKFNPSKLQRGGIALKQAHVVVVFVGRQTLPTIDNEDLTSCETRV